MSSISVVQYTPSSPNKLSNVLQQSNTNNKREVIVLRKPQHILPQPEDFKDNILITNTARKKSSSANSSKTTSNKSNPQPVAVARRNARERNRVKQVNNGFANLRQHIPNFIAQAFESNSGRGGNKKLSKVETLRMAVEYIRSLEEILAMDGVETPIMTTSQYNNYELSPSDDGFDEDDMSMVQSPPPQQQQQQQFIKINTSTNTYQIIPGNIYDNSENMDPLVIQNQIIDSSMIVDPNMDFTQDLSYLSSNYTTASLSPGMYSDQSLSPTSLELSDQKSYIPVFNSPNQEDIKVRLSPNISIKNEDMEHLPVISLKSEQEIPEEHKDNVIDVIQWWEQQQPPTSRRS